MWFRAVAAALAVWGVAGTAMAAGYTEVWNPPEASRHVVAKPGKKKPGALKAKTGAGLKTDAKHAARLPHKAARVASTVGRGGVKKAAGKGMKGGVRQAGVSAGAGGAGAAGKTKSKPVALAQARQPHTQPHTQPVHAKTGQGKVVTAALAHPARPHALGVAAKSGAVKPAASHQALPVASANYSGNTADASTNPATASSGSLPPIIH